MSKNNEEFQQLLREEVNLNQTRLDRLKGHVDAVSGHLKGHLTGYQAVESQGSYALGTLIKPVDDNDEYDADIQVVMDYDPQWESKRYLDEVRDALARNPNYAGKLKLRTRCVTINYAGDFHLDVVPRVTIDGQHYICNSVTDELEPTDGNGYRDWFNEKNRITNGNLKRVVRLLKYLRDHKSNYTAKSIMLTTLAGNAIQPCDEGTEAVSTVADTFVTVLERIDSFLQQHPNMPDIWNPVLPSETFNRHWDQRKYANFRKKVHAHALTAAIAKAQESSSEGIKVWQKLFGDDFGKGVSNRLGNGASGASLKTPSGLPRPNPTPTAAVPFLPRPGEARRFG